jgi:GT2 family glycosyltransferase
LSGCFMLIRVSYLQQVGLFDQRFFLHMEDIDLSRRLFNVCDCVFVPDFKITHLHNAESKRSLKAFIIHLSSSIRYFNKWGWFRDKNRDYLNSKVLLENWPGNHFGK